MNEDAIRRLVQEEIAKNASQSRFGLNVLPRHDHNDINSQKINGKNILPGLRTSGSVTMSSAKDYKFNVNFRPTMVQFYGNPYHTSGSIDRHTFVFGQAALGQNLYFQPTSTSSVTIGGKFEIVQSSTMFMALGSGSGTSFQAITDEEHIIDVEESGDIKARATISSYGQNFFTVTVDTLASGWTIVGNFFVS